MRTCLYLPWVRNETSFDVRFCWVAQSKLHWDTSADCMWENTELLHSSFPHSLSLKKERKKTKQSQTARIIYHITQVDSRGL